jgi:hypothetical protein
MSNESNALNHLFCAIHEFTESLRTTNHQPRNLQDIGYQSVYMRLVIDEYLEMIGAEQKESYEELAQNDLDEQRRKVNPRVLLIYDGDKDDEAD